MNLNTTNAVRVRFAPAPTGHLHIGGARTALFNWLFARHCGGTFILRIEDTDSERSDEELASDIIGALKWLGLDWDEGVDAGGNYGPYLQSQRKEIYAKYASILLEEGKAYRCYCTDEELAEKRKAALAAGKPPMYDGCCRQLTNEQRSSLENEGRSPTVRFRVPEKDVTVSDIVRGKTTFSKDVISDFIVQRSNGAPSFHLANVVDDALMKISCVIRGEDHFSNTPRHLLLYEALGFNPPQFAHISMILSPDRSKLSKRHGAVALSQYRKEGYLPEAMINYLTLLGWSPPDGKELMETREIVEKFSLERVAKSGAIFDVDKLNFINGYKIRNMPTQELVKRTKNFLGDIPLTQNENFEKMLSLTRDGVKTLSDFPQCCKLFTEEIVFEKNVLAQLKKEENLELLKEFAILLEQTTNWDRNAQSELFKNLSKKTGLKGKSLYHPIRIALTGKEEGPELIGILDVLGKEGTLTRVREALKKE